MIEYIRDMVDVPFRYYALICVIYSSLKDMIDLPYLLFYGSQAIVFV